MSKSSWVVRASVMLVLMVCVTLAVDAQGVGRAFVSVRGVNTDPCSYLQPCRTFGRALEVLQAGGEIVVLDSGGYGAATINKSCSIFVPLGIHASVSPASGDGLIIAAGATDTVLIRGLNMSAKGGVNGINVTSVGVLYVDNCQISNFSADGIRFTAPNALLVVKDTEIRDAGMAGLYLANADPIKAFVTRCNFSGCESGVEIDGQSSLVVSDSSASNNVNGFVVNNTSSAPAVMTLSQARAVNNTNGVITSASGSGAANLSFVYSLMSQNSVGLSVGAGAVARGSNPGTTAISGNTTDVSGVLSEAATLY